MPSSESFEHKILIHASGMQVLFAFLDAEAIKMWWNAHNAVIQPRPGGLLVVEWEPGQGGEDDLLGPMGGILAGTLDRAQAGRIVHFGSLHWLSPRGEAFGPTRIEIDVQSNGDPRQKPALVQVVGSGFQSGPSWERYFEVTRDAWKKTLEDLKTWCETQAPEQPDSRIMGIGDSYLAEAVLQRRRIS